MEKKRWKVLLVDDEPSIIKMVGKRLEVEGFQVIVAMEGEEALAKAEAERPDVIVLDLMLPKVNGFDICAKLKQNQRAGDIPVIAVFSGRGTVEDEKRCRKLGAAAYVSKGQGQGAGVLVAQIKALLDQGSGGEK